MFTKLIILFKNGRQFLLSQLSKFVTLPKFSSSSSIYSGIILRGQQNTTVENFILTHNSYFASIFGFGHTLNGIICIKGYTLYGYLSFYPAALL